MKKIMVLSLWASMSCSSSETPNEVKHHGIPSPHMRTWIDMTLTEPQAIYDAWAEIEKQVLQSQQTPEPAKENPGEEDVIADEKSLEPPIEQDVTPSSKTSDPTVSPEEESSLPDIDLNDEIDEDATFWVNKEYQLSKSFAPTDLKPVPAKYASGGARSLRKKTLEAFIAMAEHAEKTANIKLLVISAYRSYATQVQTFAYWKSLLGEKQAERESAWPGHSEHQLGTTMDLNAPGLTAFENFDKSEAGKWVKENAHLFGFTISYQQHTEGITGYMFEPWHIRYVGRVVAAELKKNNQVTEEFMQTLTNPPQIDFDEIGGEEACLKNYTAKARPDLQLWSCARTGTKVNRCNEQHEVIFYTCETGCYSCGMGTHDFCAQNEGSELIAKERNCKFIPAQSSEPAKNHIKG